VSTAPAEVRRGRTGKIRPADHDDRAMAGAGKAQDPGKSQDTGKAKAGKAGKAPARKPGRPVPSAAPLAPDQPDGHDSVSRPGLVVAITGATSRG
jgi:hypothetical protein